MRRARQLSDLAGGGPVVLAIGVLDGVHLGHQRVLRAAVQRARGAGADAWALSFEPHPLAVLRPHQAPALITPEPLKSQRIAALGLDGLLVLPFTPELAACEPEMFIERLRRELPPLAAVTVGTNWRFGRGARGDAALLGALAERHGFELDVVPPVLVGGQPVSSTRIRRAVQDGDLRAAAELLGRPFSVLGAVEHGRRIGHALGFPTANVNALRNLHPPEGVFAVRARVQGREFGGAAYFGRRPTFEAVPHPVLEVHLFDVDLELYGLDMEVDFVEFLRKDRRFETEAALREQIAADVARARALVNA